MKHVNWYKVNARRNNSSDNYTHCLCYKWPKCEIIKAFYVNEVWMPRTKTEQIYYIN